MTDRTSLATIMVVDDTPENLDLLREMLQREGYRVQAFPRGAMALKAALTRPPDLILLDVMMPEMNGFEVCARLKADATLKEIPVLFISASTETADKVKAFAAGGEDYVTKPFQIEEVHARVETHLRMRSMRSELEQHNLHLEALVDEKVREISDAQLAILIAVTKLAEYRDDETGHHIDRTRMFCTILAKQLRRQPPWDAIITNAYVENIFHAAPLHDIGKVGIPDSILLKPGNLTPEEFAIMKTHSIIGASTLQTVQSRCPNSILVSMGIAIARSHHEKWDGSGYPDGLAGDDIPPCARIMALADVYDALRSKRPYKPPFTHEKALEIIQEGAGRHFDPAVVAAFNATEFEFAEIRRRMDDDADRNQKGCT